MSDLYSIPDPAPLSDWTAKTNVAEFQMRLLLEALRDIDSDLAIIEELVAAWADLSFDDRRYIGTAFPRLGNALLQIEDRLGKQRPELVAAPVV